VSWYEGGVGREGSGHVHKKRLKVMDKCASCPGYNICVYVYYVEVDMNRWKGWMDTMKCG